MIEFSCFGARFRLERADLWPNLTALLGLSSFGEGTRDDVRADSVRVAQRFEPALNVPEKVIPAGAKKVCRKGLDH